MVGADFTITYLETGLSQEKVERNKIKELVTYGNWKGIKVDEKTQSSQRKTHLNSKPLPKELYYALRMDVGQEKRGNLFRPVPEAEDAGRKGKDTDMQAKTSSVEGSVLACDGTSVHHPQPVRGQNTRISTGTNITSQGRIRMSTMKS